MEEAALIDKDLYDDAIEPIFNVPRVTMGGEIDPCELNGQINRFSTSGYKNSDEYVKILEMTKNMYELNGSFVFASDWCIPIHFNRQKMSTINKARKGNILRFKQNYLCEWIGCADGALINISSLIKARTLNMPELECPKDKKGSADIPEYVLGVDVARSSTDSNNKTAIVVLRIIRSTSGKIRQVRIVNIITPPNGLNFEEQSVVIKRIFYKYGGSLDLTKSRVKAIIADSNGIGAGLIEKLLEDVTDIETNEELGCFDTMNTDDKPKTPNSPKIIYSMKAQGINTDIIRTFISYVESNKLKLVRSYDDIKDNIPKDMNTEDVQMATIQTQLFIDEVSNLRLKETSNAGKLTVEQISRKIDKDRYSAIVYGLYYINMFLDVDEDVEKSSFLDYCFFN